MDSELYTPLFLEFAHLIFKFFLEKPSSCFWTCFFVREEMETQKSNKCSRLKYAEQDHHNFLRGYVLWVYKYILNMEILTFGKLG